MPLMVHLKTCAADVAKENAVNAVNTAAPEINLGMINAHSGDFRYDL